MNADGQSTDGDPEQISELLRQIATHDGQCLLFNLHIDTSGGSAVIFPSSETSLPDTYSKLLFRVSSSFPGHLVKAAQDKGYNVTSEARFFGYKAGYEGIVDFFDIGTRASNLRWLGYPYMLRLQFHYSVAKQISEPELNEDAYRPKHLHSEGPFVLSDGASESYDARMWSHLLVRRYRQQPKRVNSSRANADDATLIESLTGGGPDISGAGLFA